MFTGLVQGQGQVAAIRRKRGDRQYDIAVAASFLKGVKLGDSIAVNGICLTVVRKQARQFSADLSAETLALTTAEAWLQGQPLNLEKSLTLGTPLGGHLVSGHVDGVAKLVSRTAQARSLKLGFSLPRALSRYVARKGSVCLDGVSLTVNQVNGSRFAVNIVPHTAQHTTLGSLTKGDRVNIEVDLIARYLERLNAT